MPHTGSTRSAAALDGAERLFWSLLLGRWPESLIRANPAMRDAPRPKLVARACGQGNCLGHGLDMGPTASALANPGLSYVLLQSAASHQPRLFSVPSAAAHRGVAPRPLRRLSERYVLCCSGRGSARGRAMMLEAGEERDPLLLLCDKRGYNVCPDRQSLMIDLWWKCPQQPR